jgi:hypothetical protein
MTCSAQLRCSHFKRSSIYGMAFETEDKMYLNKSVAESHHNTIHCSVEMCVAKNSHETPDEKGVGKIA